MPKKVIYSKKYENFDIKSDFYKNNKFYLENSKKLTKIILSNQKEFFVKCIINYQVKVLNHSKLNI